jgi:hypothetical protein
MATIFANIVKVFLVCKNLIELTFIIFILMLCGIWAIISFLINKLR